MIEDCIIPKAHDNKDYSKHDESHELYGLATPGVNEQEGHPVAWNKTSNRDTMTQNKSKIGIEVRSNRN